MRTTKRQRAAAMVASGALLASVTAVTIGSATTSAAKPKCDGKIATIVSKKRVINGTRKADVIVALGNRKNNIFGLGGRDRICGGRGEDVIWGGGGNDRLFGGGDSDRIFGQSGKDDIFGGGGFNELRGGRGRDFIKGGPRLDGINGGDGDDVLKGGGGDDIIVGGDGDDVLRGQAGDDHLDGGDGIDACSQGTGTGKITDCEGADLEVHASATPPSITAGTQVTFTVRVANHGPGGAEYTLKFDGGDTPGSVCEDSDIPGDLPRPVLFELGVDEFEYHASCSSITQDGEMWIEFTVVNDDDPVPANNTKRVTLTLVASP